MNDGISTITFRTVVVPLDSATGFSTRSLTERCYLIVEVHAAGHIGYGYCYAGHSGIEALAAVGERALGPLLIGQDPLDTTRLWHEMRANALLHGRDGLTMRVISALDIALWDLKGKLLGVSLNKLVGGLRQKAPAYASGGYYAPTSTPDEVRREVAGYREAGFTAAKIKVGRDSPELDSQRIAAARGELETTAPLMLDANNAWTTVAEAERAIVQWEQHDPYWIEEPFGPDDLESHRRLAQRIGIPVATGELQAGTERFFEIMARGEIPIIQPDAAVAGGITGFLRILPIAEATGTSVCPHWFHELHAQLAAASKSITWIECFPDGSVFNFARLLARRLPVHDGWLELDDTPGNGVIFDDKVVLDYQRAQSTVGAA